MTISEENYIKVIYHLSLVSPKGVNTNAIAGMLETKASSVTDMLKKRESVMAKMLEYIPLKRLGTPEDIAAPAIMLASDGAAYITGQIIVVDGGLTAM